MSNFYFTETLVSVTPTVNALNRMYCNKNCDLSEYPVSVMIFFVG